MTNTERLDVAKHACASVERALTSYESNRNPFHVIEAMTHVRVANAALQSLERSLAGEPEPKVGP